MGTLGGNRLMLSERRPIRIVSERFAAYQKLYGYFNRALFAPQLPPCILNPVTLKVRTPREVCASLVHEMVHLWQAEVGAPSRGGYHNREWADKMESVGLMPSTTGKPGGERVGQRMTHYVVAGGPFAAAFDALPHDDYFPWLCAKPEGDREKKKAANKARYSCPECDAHVWGKPGLAIRCNECRADFDEDL